MGEGFMMYQAWRFDCPNCQARNYVESDVHECADEEERERLAHEKLGWEPWQGDVPEGEWVTMPMKVTCWKCGKNYKMGDEA